MLLIRANRFPDSRSAPRDSCAFMILSDSSISVGMKRSAIVIIIASSWAGKWNTLSGVRSRSMPSVSAMGDVVSVSMDAPVTSRIMRIVMKNDWTTASHVNFQKPRSKSTRSPRVKNRFSTNMKISRRRIGLRDFRI